MAYWWVSQNKTHKEERLGGFLWAPQSGESGVVFTHWSNMTLVRPGDIIFSYAKQSVGAVGIAASTAYVAPQPRDFDGTWYGDGWKVDVVYHALDNPVPLATFVDDLIPLLPAKNSPITVAKKGVQGYLFAIPPKAGQLICNRLDRTIAVEDVVASALPQTVPDRTVREALIKARIGQGRWRQDLLRHWSGRCAVSGLEVEALLRASHIKPWRDADNRERLDVSNGLILGPAYDAAFDAGLIGFEDSGTIVVSSKFPTTQLGVAGINPSARLSSIVDAIRPYLAYHRQNIFQAI